MSPALRLAAVIFSLFAHSGLAGLFWLISASSPATEETVYHVSLAALADPQIAQPAAPPEPSPPLMEETPPPPSVQQAPVNPAPPKAPESKKISPRKKQESPKAASPQAESLSPQASPHAAEDTSPRPNQVGGLMAYSTNAVEQAPTISRRVAPNFPSRAKLLHIEGKVVVHLVVDTSGLPQACAVHASNPSGYFEEAALEAVRKTRFIPGKIKGQAVNTVVVLPFVFQLR